MHNTTLAKKMLGKSLFGWEIEHVEISREEMAKNLGLLEQGQELIDYSSKGSYQVLTYRLSVNPLEYATILSEKRFIGEGLHPVNLEIIAGEHTETPEEAVQLHFDAINCLNSEGR